jgi:transposase
VLVEFSDMEQRYHAVLAVIQDGRKVTEVASRLGVSRQSDHAWIARYEKGGLASLADRSHRPSVCPHQITSETEALICELRREHPGWGPRRIEHQLARRGIEPLPARSSIYRCLRRHGLIELRRRRRHRDEFRRWERERPMQMWQMDVMGGVDLDDGSELKIVTGVDDDRRFCVTAGSSAGQTPKRCARSWPPRSPATGSPTRSSPTTARFSPGGSVRIRPRSCSTGSAARTESVTASPRRGHRRRRARSNGSTGDDSRRPTRARASGGRRWTSTTVGR